MLIIIRKHYIMIVLSKGYMENQCLKSVNIILYVRRFEIVSENDLEFANFVAVYLVGLEYAHLSGQIRDPL